MSSYDENIEPSFLEYLGSNDLYVWTMCKKYL